MTETLYELEGTWEELEQHAPALQGKRLRLSVMPDEPAATSRHIEDAIGAIFSDIPAEEWDKIPADLSEQVDHYVYGTPKR